MSTDDSEIAEVSKKYGADVPFMRPAELATNKSTSVDVVLHAINTLESTGIYFEYIVLLQPTSPLRTHVHIDQAFAEIVKKKGDAIISVCKAEHHPLWCNSLDNNLDMSNFVDNSIRNIRSQDLPEIYRLNGAIYIIKVAKFKKEKDFFLNSKCSAIIMKQEDSVDIDTKIEFDFASMIMSKVFI